MNEFNKLLQTHAEYSAVHSKKPSASVPHHQQCNPCRCVPTEEMGRHLRPGLAEYAYCRPQSVGVAWRSAETHQTSVRTAECDSPSDDILPAPEHNLHPTVIK